MSIIRRAIDWATIQTLRWKPADRVAGYLAYQRRRKSRRVAEERLAKSGQYPDEIVRGPFRGMKLPPRDKMFYDCRFEKTFGIYEHELFDTIGELTTTPLAFEQVVIAGAADGIYAVGLSLLLPDLPVVAYESSSARAEVLRETARINNRLHKIEIRGFCSPEDLESTLKLRPSLLVCDVDGYENTLLDPATVPHLRQTVAVVETHDCFVPGIATLLKERFRPTHQTQEIFMRGIDYGQFPFLHEMSMHEVDSLTGSDRAMLQTWLWMRPTS